MTLNRAYINASYCIFKDGDGFRGRLTTTLPTPPDAALLERCTTYPGVASVSAGELLGITELLMVTMKRRNSATSVYAKIVWLVTAIGKEIDADIKLTYASVPDDEEREYLRPGDGLPANIESQLIPRHLDSGALVFLGGSGDDITTPLPTGYNVPRWSWLVSAPAWMRRWTDRFLRR